MFPKERGRQDIKYYNIWLKKIQRAASLENSQKSSIRLHCRKWQNVRVIFANKISKDFFRFASLWMICEINFTLNGCSGANHNYSWFVFSASSFVQPPLAHCELQQILFCVHRSVCRPGSAGWCVGLVNSFQKDIQSEQEVARVGTN